jgi:hypothetical protein
VISFEDKVIAQHSRSYGQEEVIFKVLSHLLRPYGRWFKLAFKKEV